MPGLPPPKDRLLLEQVRRLVCNVPALVVGTVVLARGTAALSLMNGHTASRVTVWLDGDPVCTVLVVDENRDSLAARSMLLRSLENAPLLAANAEVMETLWSAGLEVMRMPLVPAMLQQFITRPG